MPQLPEPATSAAPPAAWRRQLAVPAPQPGRCPNCGAAWPEPAPNFCPDCGQESRLKPPTLLEFAQQFGGSYIAMEGALWRTLWRLLLLPGQLTLEYFAGRRRRYVLPLRLYLTISVLALVLLRLVTTSQLASMPESVMKIEEGDNRHIKLSLGPFEAGLKDGQFYCNKFPASVCSRLKRRLQFDPQSMAIEMQEAPTRFFGHLGTAMFLLLPAYALWLKLVYYDKRRRYTEHLVYALHLYAFWFVALLLLMLSKLAGLPLLPGLAVLAAMAYPLIAMHRVYPSRWWSTALRALALLLLSGGTLALALVMVFVWTLLS